MWLSSAVQSVLVGVRPRVEPSTTTTTTTTTDHYEHYSWTLRPPPTTHYYPWVTLSPPSSVSTIGGSHWLRLLRPLIPMSTVPSTTTVPTTLESSTGVRLGSLEHGYQCVRLSGSVQVRGVINMCRVPSSCSHLKINSLNTSLCKWFRFRISDPFMQEHVWMSQKRPLHSSGINENYVLNYIF
jgi:hypothetical protein